VHVGLPRIAIGRICTSCVPSGLLPIVNEYCKIILMIDIARLRLLQELAYRGTMTAVAAARGLTSSAVSQQLATLEREARVKLFERIGRRVRLTSESERLVTHAENILRSI
jgi:hypothetical protein